MRRFPVILSVTTLAVLGLAGCSSAESSASASCTPMVGTDAVLASLEVDGSLDAMPAVDLPVPFHADETATATVAEGDGAVITDAGQLIGLDVTFFSGDTGEAVLATSYDASAATVNTVSRWTENFPGLSDALMCATEGERLVVALAPGDYSETAASSLGLGSEDSLVAVVDVRSVYLGAADGADQYTESHGLPTVVRAPDGRPGVIIPDADAPDDLVVQTLKKGDGATVEADDTVYVQYTGVLWDDREVFDSTWDGDPATLTLDAVVPGFADGLEGQTVGSQVLIVIPPELGYGESGQGTIPADATLVFVVDILGVDAS